MPGDEARLEDVLDCDVASVIQARTALALIGEARRLLGSAPSGVGPGRRLFAVALLSAEISAEKLEAGLARALEQEAPRLALAGAEDGEGAMGA